MEIFTKRKRVIALLLAVVLVVTPAQQVHAENTNLSGTENIEDAELFNEPVSEEDSESSETDEDTTEKKMIWIFLKMKINQRTYLNLVMKKNQRLMHRMKLN